MMEPLRRFNFQFRGGETVSHAGPGHILGHVRYLRASRSYRAPGGRSDAVTAAAATAARERGEVGNLTGLNGFNSM